MNETLRDARETLGRLECSEREQEKWWQDRVMQLENDAADALIARLQAQQEAQEAEEAEQRKAQQAWQRDVESWRRARAERANDTVLRKDYYERSEPTSDALIQFVEVIAEETARS